MKAQILQSTLLLKEVIMVDMEEEEIMVVMEVEIEVETVAQEIEVAEAFLGVVLREVKVEEDLVQGVKSVSGITT